MFKDIGNSLKKLATIVFWLETISSVVFAGLFLKANYYRLQYGGGFSSPIRVFENPITIALLMVVVGLITAWLTTCMLYAFGQLVDDVHVLRLNRETDNRTIEDAYHKGKGEVTKNYLDEVADQAK